MSTYAKRLLKAIEHSRQTQAAVAKAAGTTQQVISGIITRNSAHSGYTAQIAHVCGVSPYWLATGKGTMLGLREPVAGYGEPLSKEAEDIARAWMKLSPPLAASVRTMIFHMASAHSVAKWLMIEPPKNHGYAAWEEAIQRAYDAEIKQQRLNFGE